MSDFTFMGSFDLNKQLQMQHNELLKQYGLHHSLVAAQFAFSSKFEPNNSTAFVNDFFSSSEVQANFPLPDITGKRNCYFQGKQTAEISPISVSATHTKHLMPAISERYIGSSSFKGMKPETLQFYDMTVNYLIDSALFDNRSEDYKTFSNEWRNQLLNQIFMILRAGGTMNQQSEKVDDYVDLAIDIYKQLVNPVRLEAEDKLTLKHVFAFEVKSLSNNFELFPSNPDLEKHPGNKCFLIIDSLRRYCCILHNSVWV